ncbi:hypothetical protein BDR07DRAFT_1308705, partial [Suillus spraguei]
YLYTSHIAKTFTLREAPNIVTDGKNKATRASKRHVPLHQQSNTMSVTQNQRAQGRLSKKGGKIISNGNDELQIASGVGLDSPWLPIAVRR